MIRVSKKKAKDFLSNAPEDKIFWVNDGRVLRNLKELSQELGDIEDETFSFHVNKDKNDFKNWIKDVIGDKKLAKDIVKTRKKKIMLGRINRRVEQLTKIIK